MTICRMMTPGLLVALMHAESWVDHNDCPDTIGGQSDRSGSKAGNRSAEQGNARHEDEFGRSYKPE